MRKISLKGLRKKADAALSKYVCKRDHNICVTCTKQGNQGGHFVGRSFWGTRYDEHNVHCQDYRCNIPLKGNMIAYYEFMENKYGKRTINELKQMKNWTVIKWVNWMRGNPIFDSYTTTREAYEYIIDYYTKKLERL